MKVLIVTPNLPEYRYPIFQQLADHCELTVLHSGNEIRKVDIKFRQIIILVKNWGPFTVLAKPIHKLCKKFDIIVSEANIRHLDRDLLLFNPFREYKWITWGIGVSASYNKKYDTDKSLDKLRHFIFKRADANIFYSEYPVKKYVKAGFKPSSLFIANNTTYVDYDGAKEYKKSKLLFIGTLYKEKKIYDLLNSYKVAYSLRRDIPTLDIIGNGNEYNSIDEWINANALERNIRLLGAIFDHSILQHHFRTSLACISPGQAGLSVLTSMGYGTPYITMRNAITGGEIFNIKNNETGILYNNGQDLTSIIIDICDDPRKYIQMGLNARQHYVNHRQVKDMIKGFLDAFTYVLNP